MRPTISSCIVTVSLLFGPMVFQAQTVQSDDLSRQAEVRAAAIERENRVIRNRSIVNYVQDLGERLAGFSGQSNVPHQIRVLDEPEVGVFALPGGYLYLSKGIIEFCRNESELAAVLAHEISHLARHHNPYRLRGATGREAALENEDNSSPDVSMNYELEAEREADRLAVSILRRCGINPAGMAALLDRIESSHKATTGTCFSADSNLAGRRARITGLLLASDSNLASDSRRFQRERWLLSVDSLFPVR